MKLTIFGRLIILINKNQMGNSQKLEDSKESILWLDKNVYNDENTTTYKIYLQKLGDYNFFCFTSVKKLINYIVDNLDYFEFRLFYVVVSGRLAESFFNVYVKIAEKYNIIADTIVYCFRQEYHQKKPYFMDNFLNAGGITKNFKDILNYIIMDKYDWENIEKTYQKYAPENGKFGETFRFIDVTKEYNLALPILIGSMINSSFVEKDEIIKFQNLLLSRYCKCYEKKDLKSIKPSYNKNLNIPLHILTKFFIKFYTSQVKKEKSKFGNNFYNDLNNDLSNNKFDDYLPFIFLIYDCLNRKIIKSYTKKLYRGSKISKNELKNLIEKFNKNKNEKPIYCSNCFLSFSKEFETAKTFMNEKPKPDEENVLYILDECKNEKYFVSNMDIESLSSFKTEKEVLHLPFSSFEIVGIKKVKANNKVDYFIINLNHLDKYQEKIKLKIKELREKNESKEINDFFVSSKESDFGKKILEFYDKKHKIKINFAKIINLEPILNIGKSIAKIGATMGISITANLAMKAGILGFSYIIGVSMCPFVTQIISVIGGNLLGYKVNNLVDKLFGKDELKLTSAHLYYNYIPEKYRKPGNNPHLQWSNHYLCANIESFIIECIVNDSVTQMRVINIPRDVFELPECLGEFNNTRTCDDTDTTSDDNNDENSQNHKIYKNNKFIGDLIIPYKGIQYNDFKVEFILYGIKKKEISDKEWEETRDGKDEEKLIQFTFVYSVI